MVGGEPALHWVLDVTFHKDASRIKKGNAPENFGLLRRLALCLLKKETSSKRSLKGKRLRASWDDSYLERVLCGNTENSGAPTLRGVDVLNEHDRFLVMNGVRPEGDSVGNETHCSVRRIARSDNLVIPKLSANTSWCTHQ